MINEFLKTAIYSVESSGQVLIDYFENLHDFKQKNQNPRDLVSEVDILSEKNIKKIITSNFPEHTIIGEESGEEKHNSEYRWHIDPLDGTVNYSQGIPFCAVSVGLEKRNEVIVGAIFNPLTEEIFFASKGNGAYFNGKEIQVSQKKSLEEGLFVAAFSASASSEKSKEYEIFGKMNDTTRGVLRTGSAALSMAYLACGRVDGFWVKNYCSWDIAAGIILINEAGGSVSTLNKSAFSFQDSILVASNGLMHESLLDRLKDL